jgi:hypothetical protein
MSGTGRQVKLRRAIQRRIRRSGAGTDVSGIVNAVVAANVNEPGPSHTHVSSKQRIVQRGGRTEVFESEQTTKGGPE